MNILLLQGGSASGFDLPFMLMMGGVMLVMWLFIFRPQSKKVKEEQQFSENVVKGDKIITKGGIHGKVVKLYDDTAIGIEVAPQMIMKIERTAISSELSAQFKKDTGQKKS